MLGDYRGRPWDERADVWIILAKRARRCPLNAEFAEAAEETPGNVALRSRWPLRSHEPQRRAKGVVKFLPRQVFFLEFSHVRPFKMGVDQAQEGRPRREARQDFHAPHQGTHRRGPRRRRRPRHEPAPAHHHRRREGGEHARREHQARHPPRHGRGAGRVVRGSAVRRLRPGRRRGHHRRPHRQQEPHGRRAASRARKARRQPRRQPTPSPGCSPRRATSSSRSRRPTKRS